MKRFNSHVHRERPLNGLENGYKIGQRVFWFLVCYAAPQLATQLPQRRIQVVRSNKGVRWRSVLARRHRAHSSYYLCTPKTDTATLQEDRTIWFFWELSTKSQKIGPGDLGGFQVSLSGLRVAFLLKTDSGYPKDTEGFITGKLEVFRPDFIFGGLSGLKKKIHKNWAGSLTAS